MGKFWIFYVFHSKILPSKGFSKINTFLLILFTYVRDINRIEIFFCLAVSIVCPLDNEIMHVSLLNETRQSILYLSPFTYKTFLIHTSEYILINLIQNILLFLAPLKATYRGIGIYTLCLLCLRELTLGLTKLTQYFLYFPLIGWVSFPI